MKAWVGLDGGRAIRSQTKDEVGFQYGLIGLIGLLVALGGWWVRISE